MESDDVNIDNADSIPAHSKELALLLMTMMTYIGDLYRCHHLGPAKVIHLNVLPIKNTLEVHRKMMKSFLFF